VEKLTLLFFGLRKKDRSAGEPEIGKENGVVGQRDPNRKKTGVQRELKRFHTLAGNMPRDPQLAGGSNGGGTKKEKLEWTGGS